MRYVVFLVQEVSSVVEIEAGSLDEAMEEVWDHPNMPGNITVGAFGPASVDDSDWDIYQVTDESGQTVYERDRS